MEKVGALGCIVCRLFEGVFTPCSIHHIDGRTKPGAHYDVLGLCGRHHQIADNHLKRWYSRHGDGKVAFEKAYGTERDLYLKILELLDEQIQASWPLP